MGTILSINVGVPEAGDAADIGVTGIGKRPVAGPVPVRAPGPKGTGLGSGVVGDHVCDGAHHGGDDQAVYAYAREDYDWWERELGRRLPGGLFGENLTTSGVDVNGALVGQRWRVGDQVVLEAVLPRIPCRTFAAKLGEPDWIRRFTRRGLSGAYLRVVEPGRIEAGDAVVVVHQPDHDLSIGAVFRALTLEPELLPRLVEIEELPEGTREQVRRRLNR